MTDKPSERFADWVKEHYEMVIAEATAAFACRRCGQQVHYLTKHAAVRHGDDIEVMPVQNREYADSY